MIPRLVRRHPANTADLAHLQTELDHERAHSADLARQLAELREDNRHLVEGRDHWRGEARRHVAEVIALRQHIEEAAARRARTRGAS